MPSLPVILLLLSLPAGAVAYVAATSFLQTMSIESGLKAFLVLIVPLFVAGLVMVPFLIPWFDRKARADLEAHRRAVEATSDVDPVDASDHPIGAADKVAAGPMEDAAATEDPVATKES